MGGSANKAALLYGLLGGLAAVGADPYAPTTLSDRRLTARGSRLRVRGPSPTTRTRAKREAKRLAKKRARY